MERARELPIHHKCSVPVKRSSYAARIHWPTCNNPGTVNIDGKWYCKRHTVTIPMEMRVMESPSGRVPRGKEGKL